MKNFDIENNKISFNDKNYVKEYVKERKNKLKEELILLEDKPSLCIIQVGDNFASNKYVNGKLKDCEEVGIESTLKKFDENISEEKLLLEIENANSSYDGIIVQLPLPKHIDVKKVQNTIDDKVDVDGFKTSSIFIPCTPLGVFNLLNKITNLDGKNIVILGRSEIVGKPMANLLISESNATVTICNSHTKNISNITKNADIIISAIGKAKFIKKDMVKENVIIVDVGINQDENGKMCGDVDYENVKSLCKFITPVPGGVGLLTRLTLLENTFLSFKMRMGAI